MMLRRILIYLLTFPSERRAQRAASERLERLGNSPEDWNRPMSHFPTAGTGAVEEDANYVPSWAEPEK